MFGGLNAFLGPWGNTSRSFSNGIVFAFVSGCRCNACIVVKVRRLRRALYAGPMLSRAFSGPARIASVVCLASSLELDCELDCNS